MALSNQELQVRPHEAVPTFDMGSMFVRTADVVLDAFMRFPT